MAMESRAVRIEELLAHADWVRRLAARLVRDPAAADDVTQEVWTRALRSPPRARTNLRGWLAASVRTSVQALRRGERRRSEREQSSWIERDEPGAAELVERAELHRKLVETVLALDEPQRSLVLAHWFEGRSLAAIARSRATTPRVARARLDEAHAELRRRLDAADGGRGAWLAAFAAWTHTPAAIATGSGITIGALTMGTKAKVVIACAAALLLWIGLQTRAQPAEPETSQAPVAKSKAPALEAPGSGERNALATATAVPPSSLDAFLDVEVTDAFTHEPVPDVALPIGFDPGATEWYSKLTEAEKSQLHTESHTDARGKSTIAVPSGVPLSVFSTRKDLGVAGFVQDQAPLAPGEHRRVRIELNIAPDMHLFVRVLAKADRHPIEGAVASLTLRPPFAFGFAQDRARRPESVNEDAATSDTAGGLDFRFGSWRLMNLRVHAAGFTPAFVFPQGHSTPDDPLEVLLERGASATLHVVDLAGLPVEGVEIELKGDSRVLVQPAGSAPPRGAMWPSASWSGTTRADGRCTIDELPSAMTLRPKLSKPGVNARGTPDPFTLEAGEQREILWRFGAVCSISGRVLDAENKPVAGVELWLRCMYDSANAQRFPGANYFFQQYQSSISASTTSDASGAYRFDNVAPGIAWVGPACKRGQGAAPIAGEPAPIADEVEIAETAQAVEHDIHLQPGLYVRGRVLDAQGKPVRTFVRMRAEGGNNAWIDQSAEDGTFTAGPVGPGAFVVRADSVPMSSFVASEEQTVHAGDADVVLRLRAGAGLEATIVDDESGEACNARLVLSLRGGDSIGPYVNLSSDPAHFSCTSVLPGLYDVMARTLDGRVGLVRGVDIQTRGTTDLVVRVKRAARLRARLEGKHAWGALIVHSAEAEVVRDAVSRGAVFDAWVPPGHLVIEFTPVLTEKPERREIDVQAGEEAELVFRDEG